MQFIRSITYRLVLVVALPLLVMSVGLLTMYLTWIGPELHRHIGQDLREINAAQAVVAESWIRAKQRDVSLLARRAADPTVTQERLLEDMRWMAGGDDSMRAVLVADSEGHVIVDSIRGTGGSIADRPYFQMARSGQSHVSGLLTARTSTEPIIVVAEPVRAAEGDPVTAVVAAIVTPGTAAYEISRSFDSDLSRTEILDARLRSISHPHHDERLVLGDEVFHSTLRYPDRNGEDVFGVASVVYPGGWIILTETPYATVMRPFERINRTVAASLWVTLIAAIGFAVLAGRRITRPIAALEALGDRLTAGSYVPGDRVRPPADCPLELARLHERLSDMADSIAAREEEVRSINAKLVSSLDQKSILLREVHHRVRNNLAVLRGIVSLSGEYYDRGSDAHRVVSSLFSRIAAMSLIHDQVYLADQVQELQLDSYLNGLAAIIVYEYGDAGDRIELESASDEVMLDPDTTLNVGLIVGELVHNAVVHAFPDGRDGRISLEMHRSGEDELLIGIEDDGVGGLTYDTEGRNGIGLQVVDQLAGQLHATVAMVPLDRGSRMELRLPLAVNGVRPQPVSG